jgi:hypothetical protein
MYKLFCIKCIKKLPINLIFIFEPRINYCILSSICFSRLLYKRLVNTLPLQIEPKKDDKLLAPTLGRAMPLGKN